MLTILAHTARDLVIGLLATCLLVGFAIFIGYCIHRAEEEPVFVTSSGPKDAGDLDDWLARDEPDFDFKMYRQPEASVHVERRAA
jgi:hypothetical protein